MSDIKIRLLPYPKKLMEKQGYYCMKSNSASSNSAFIEDEVILCRIDESLGKEHFKISITPESILITSGDNRGIIYAKAVLSQIFSQFDDRIPCLEIEDYPDMSHRAYYLDQTRGRVCHVEELKKFIDKLSFYRYNELQLYIEHTYAFECVPELWQGESCFTREDILELDKYCREKEIEFIPSLSCFGHLYKLLRLDKYKKFCEISDDNSDFSFYDRMQHHTMAVCESEGIELIKKMLSEYVSLFSSDRVNICCDETFDLCSDRSKHLLKDKSKDEIYIEYVRQLCEYVISLGKTPMIWGDVIAGNIELFKKLPPETICLSWGYGLEEKDDHIKALAEGGVSQYVCPGICGWNQLIPKIRNSFINIKTMYGYGYKYDVTGFMVTDWGDFGHINHPMLSLPGVIISACMAWNKDYVKQDFDTLSKDISILEYGDTTGEFVDLLAQISDLTDNEWFDIVAYCEKGIELSECGRDPSEEEKVSLACRQRLEAIEKCLLNSTRDNKRLLAIIQNAAQGICILKKLRYKKDCDCSKLTQKWFASYRDIFLENSREGDLEKAYLLLCKYIL